MKSYVPEKPLISLHIPKCGGQSVTEALKDWFGRNCFIHYFQANNNKPEKYKFSGQICIHGHFNNEKGFGARQYYPDADQFITFIRDPLEIAVSNYFFWKSVARKRQLELGMIKEGGDHDYKDIDDFFLKRDRSHVFNFIPFKINKNNLRKIVEDEFLFIGLTDYMQESLNVLSNILGFARVDAKKLNTSDRDEILSRKVKEKFIEDNRFVFGFYRYVEKQYKTKYKQFI